MVQNCSILAIYMVKISTVRVMLVHHQSDKIILYLDGGLFEYLQEFHDQSKKILK